MASLMGKSADGKLANVIFWKQAQARETRHRHGMCQKAYPDGFFNIHMYSELFVTNGTNKLRHTVATTAASWNRGCASTEGFAKAFLRQQNSTAHEGCDPFGWDVPALRNITAHEIFHVNHLKRKTAHKRPHSCVNADSPHFSDEYSGRLHHILHLPNFGNINQTKEIQK